MKDEKARKKTINENIYIYITFGYAKGMPKATGSETNTDCIRIPEGDEVKSVVKTAISLHKQCFERQPKERLISVN